MRLPFVSLSRLFCSTCSRSGEAQVRNNRVEVAKTSSDKRKHEAPAAIMSFCSLWSASPLFGSIYMAQPIQVYPHLFGIEGIDHSHNSTTHKPLHPTTEELSSRSLTMDAITATFTSSISKTETTPVNEERAARWSGIGPGMCVIA